MEIVVAPIVVFLLFFPQIIAAFLAKSMGRKFWFWFWISFLIPLISIIILLCLEDKSTSKPIQLADHVKKN